MSGGGDIVLKVQLFAKAKELAGGKSSIQISLQRQHASITCEEFLDRYIFEAEPALRALKGSAFLAVNDEYALAEQGVCELDVRLVQGPVPYEVPPKHPGGGGENSFLGRTREEKHDTHGQLVLLRYEAKESMAVKLLKEIAAECGAKHGLLYVRIVHALGDVPIGEASVLVQVLSPHRKEAFEATMEIMNKLKSKVPIWKQEVWEDGSTWKDGAVVDPSS